MLNQQIEACQLCPRLITHCSEVARVKRKAFRDSDYWGKPVPNFGPRKAELLVVGLAPGAHGANRTGRMFTGDRSGDWLFAALHKAGYASQPNSDDVSDRLKLTNCAITNVCHCAPPGNKPVRDEINACRPFLDDTIRLLRPKIFLALGGLAWNAIIDVALEENWLESPKPRPKFGHGLHVKLLPPPRSRMKHRWLVGSYHVSQQNTFTGRLTKKMLDDVFKNISRLLKD